MNVFANPASLTEVEAECWRRLQLSVADRDSGWRLPVLATVDARGLRQRTVVLRGVNADDRIIRAHTDIRSDKIASLRSHPNASWLFYDHRWKSQLQLTGHITIHTDDPVADRLWDEESEQSLRGFLAPLPPGTRCDGPTVNLPEELRNRSPERDELAVGRQNFAVLQCNVQSAEWVLLRSDGNLRARFVYVEQNDCLAEWLAP
ncbi:MAG: pyridoxamine 5'-phosphate oxidase family protein [Fuerstiella sp.]